MIEQGEVFYSKAYRGRVTYLSRELYWQIKPHKQRMEKLTPVSRAVLEFVRGMEIVTTKDIKDALMLSSKELGVAMDGLFKELLVTAVKRDRTMSANWSSFCWGGFECWEKVGAVGEIERDETGIYKMLSGIMTDRQIESLLK
ncbi:MAG: hypothetical protein FWC93_04995 [Defluviitaleaceae bacterium]|nr:hypothetical protein [Defluviitaleaceae bacterium]